MKRQEFIRTLVAGGCFLKRRGRKHDLYTNLHTGRSAPVPRHTEIKNSLCALILKQLGILS
jgi:mRNA interferase HicA